MNKILTTFLILIFPITLKGQYYQCSQFNYSEQRVNPGAISQDDFATASFIYRSQQSLSDVELNSFMFSAKYPFIARNGGDRWSAIGLTFSEDQAGLGGLFETNELGVTYALNFKTGKKSMLSVGNRITYQSRRINTQNITTGSQFVPGVGFDNDLNVGEDLGEGNTNFLTISTGLSWEKKDKKGRRLAHLGASAFNFNRPNESLLGRDSPLPISNVFEGGILAYTKGDMSIYPEFVYTRSQSTNNLNVGAVTSFKLDKYDSRLSGQEVLFHTKYLLNEGVMLGVQWRRGPLSVGTSYDIPLNNRVANRGAFELGLELGALIKSKNKPRKPKRKKRKKNNGDNSRDNISSLNKNDSTEIENLADNIEEEKEINLDENDTADVLLNDSDTSPEGLANDTNTDPKARVGDFKNIRTNEPIYFNFNFKTDEAKLSRDDEKILYDLIIFMRNNPNASVDIEGHTDNVGDEDYNYKLSRRRAQAVARYLTKNGISRERISHKGYGEEKPLVENSSKLNRAKNRRVEFVIHHNQ